MTGPCCKCFCCGLGLVTSGLSTMSFSTCAAPALTWVLMVLNCSAYRSCSSLVTVCKTGIPPTLSPVGPDLVVILQAFVLHRTQPCSFKTLLIFHFQGEWCGNRVFWDGAFLVLPVEGFLFCMFSVRQLSDEDIHQAKGKPEFTEARTGIKYIIVIMLLSPTSAPPPSIAALQ